MIRAEQIVVEDMGSLHPTWLDKLRKCEKLGFSEIRGGDTRKQDVRKIGIAVHSYCAMKLKGEKFDDWDMFDELRELGCTDAEINGVFEYLEELEKFDVYTVEESFETVVGGEVVRGKIDAVVGIGGEIFVLDHKTSRVMGDIHEWEMQGRLYLRWARQKYGAKMFMVGYVFIGRFDAIDYRDAETEGIVEGLMLGLRYGAKKGEFVEKFGKHCSWCKMRGECDTYKSSVFGFDARVLEEMSLRAKWDLLKSVEKNVKEELEKIEKEVLSSERVEGFKVKVNRRRKVNVEGILSVLGIPVELAGLLSIRLGGLDVLKRKLSAEKRKELEELISWEETGSCTIA